MSNHSFKELFNSKMYGVLSWKQFDAHWARLAANPDGWYVWECAGELPDAPLSAADFTTFLDETKAFLEKQDTSGHLGFMYANDPQDAAFFKIFHPKRMGSSCGCSSVAILPAWTISRVKPEALLPVEKTEKKPHGLQRLLARL
ncbi:MAG TPA: hypothetical protein ENJ99_07090 [Rhizobiales bacterium]|nr:hypothetical protein [Hyphomicrobiales bacterium]